MKEISRQRKWQLKKIKENLCSICGRDVIYLGCYCKRHYKYHIESAIKRYRNMPMIEKKKLLKKVRAYHHKKKNAGLCTRCGKKNDRKERTSCASCAVILKRKYYKYIKKEKRGQS